MHARRWLGAACATVALAACSVAAVRFSLGEEVCATPGDEDNNELSDCDDPACLGSPSCQLSAPACGDGHTDAGEQCDDGNRVDGDGCEADCSAPSCGNGITDVGEQCDDGNRLDGDDCEADCTTPFCRNGIVDPREECDDGNLVEGDACDSNCTTPRCQNQIVDPGEECDDGNGDRGDACNPDCTRPICGDRFINPGEDCDQGGATATCDTDCTLPACNDGELNLLATEERDPPSSPSQIVPVSEQTCRFDFSAVNQLFCAGVCGGPWGGGNGCQQADADAFCRLKTGNPASVATSFLVGLASAAPGICCPIDPPDPTAQCTDLGTFPQRGVTQHIFVHETNLRSTHGLGQVITDLVCGQ